jgi:hypothetical protein
MTVYAVARLGFNVAALRLSKSDRLRKSTHVDFGCLSSVCCCNLRHGYAAAQCPAAYPRQIAGGQTSNVACHLLPKKLTLQHLHNSEIAYIFANAVRNNNY